MPLPSYAPRSDSFGNWYFGGFQVDSAVESGYGAGTALNQTQSEFDTFLNSAIGSTNWTKNTNTYFFRLNNSYEPLTGTVTTTTGWRFQQNAVNASGVLNTAPTGTPVGLATTNGIIFNNMWSNTQCAFAVVNQFGMWLCYGAKGGTPGTISTSVVSQYLGWAKDPVFPTNTADRVRNLIMGIGTGNTAGTCFVSTGAASSTNSQKICVTNSVITCSVSTPGANVSDLCFLDSNTSYLNIGSAYNALFYPGTGLTVGQIYRIPPAQDPDGNTEQNIWLCAGQVQGWNGTAQVANAGYKLIRVWSDNIT